ncbi:RING finger protein 212B-like isoform X2 [Haliotis rubra]|uniref:RING finger protein 212B-like isoform X2 n=1 Tax=Haliotis rubra TaxID=36100 RepID=UPI001EE53EFE|nr:RING finger protein 212B-like isoform X2 [Haliotis rubra]
MVDWLHCNLCFIQPGAGANFSLTNCGHIYCEKCLVEVDVSGCKERCRMCGSNCTIIKLSANMKPEVELFFTDPVDILRKCLKQAIQVLDFQKNHRGRMLSHFKGKVSKQQEVLDKAQHSILKYQQVERELIRLREENSYLKRLISEKGLGSHSRPGVQYREHASSIIIAGELSSFPNQIPWHPDFTLQIQGRGTLCPHALLQFPASVADFRNLTNDFWPHLCEDTALWWQNSQQSSDTHPRLPQVTDTAICPTSYQSAKPLT